MRIPQFSKIVSFNAIFAFLGVIMILHSCSSHKLLLVGTWERSSGDDSVVLTLHSDGSFVAQLENEVLGGIFVKRGNISGTWKVNDGRLIAKVTESTTGMVKVGHTWSDEIVDVSKTRLVLRAQSGDTEEYTRAQSK